MKKRIPTIILMFTLFLTHSFAAEYSVYEVGDTGITVSLPSSDYVITADTPLDSPVFAFLGLSDPQSAIDQNIANDIFIDAVNMDYTYEIVVGSPELDDIGSMSMSEFDKETIIQTAEMMKSQFEEAGSTLLNYEICLDYSQPFLVLDLSQQMNDQQIYSREYYTIVNGTALFITLHNMTGTELSPENHETLASVVNSVSFPEASISDATHSSNSIKNDIPDENSATPLTQKPYYDTLVKIVSGLASCFIVVGIVTVIRKTKSKS